MHLFFYCLFVLPSALSNIIILRLDQDRINVWTRLAHRVLDCSSGVAKRQVAPYARTIQVGYAKARWCCFHHILWQQPKTGRPPTDTMCVLVTSASPLHLKQKRHKIRMTLQMCLHCPDENKKTENTIFSHHKGKNWRQGDRLRTRERLCRSLQGASDKNHTFLLFQLCEM